MFTDGRVQILGHYRSFLIKMTEACYDCQKTNVQSQESRSIHDKDQTVGTRLSILWLLLTGICTVTHQLSLKKNRHGSASTCTKQGIYVYVEKVGKQNMGPMLKKMQKDSTPLTDQVFFGMDHQAVQSENELFTQVTTWRG